LVNGKEHVTVLFVRDVQVVEEELAEIAGIQDDLTKFERIVAWSAVHPDEVVFAVRFLSGRSRGLDRWIEQHTHGETV
jgi:hypothetical protein